MSLSTNQTEILNAIIDGKSIYINSCAGSGKTYLFVQVAHKCKDLGKKILLLTYNRDVRKSNKKKILEKKLVNAEAHNYHTFAREYYNQEKGDDSVVYNASNLIACDIPDFVILYVDECQDLTDLFLNFVHNIFQNIQEVHGIAPQIVYSGDPSQLLYEGAMGVDIFKFFKEHGVTFVTHHLPVSYRVPRIVGEYVNTDANPTMLHKYNSVLWKERKDRIIPQWGSGIVGVNGEGTLIREEYTFLHGYKKIAESISAVINARLKAGDAPHDFAILSYTWKGHINEKIRKIVMGKVRIPWQMESEETIHTSTTATSTNKGVFTTIHKSKGREWKHVFLLWAEDYIFSMNDPEIALNLKYVGCTRCLEGLYLYTDVAEQDLWEKNPMSCPMVTVTKLINRLPFDPKMTEEKMFTITRENIGKNAYLCTDVCNVKSEYAGFEITENISKLLGNMFEFEIKTKFAPTYSYGKMIESVLNMQNKAKVQNKLLIKTMKAYADDCSYLSYRQKIKIFLASGYESEPHLWRQLCKLQKLDKTYVLSNIQKNVDKFVNGLERKYIQEQRRVEQIVDGRTISGIIDFFDSSTNTVYETKVSVSSLSFEHLLQVSIYSALLQLELKKPVKASLFYINEGVIYDIVRKEVNPELFLKTILEWKFGIKN